MLIISILAVLFFYFISGASVFMGTKIMDTFYPHEVQEHQQPPAPVEDLNMQDNVNAPQTQEQEQEQEEETTELTLEVVT